ncbi:MAG TPA: M20/M25/M40 family metallo-hydrolase [Vicinamibacterales bacterium]|jgi:acetylornithine deacetylase/succinyl-diaminopimelate desuccinylase-like protein
MTRNVLAAIVAAALASTAAVLAQGSAQPDWKPVEEETLRHYQALVRLDTTTKERAAAEYLKRVLDENGIPAQLLSLESDRPNVIARLKGNGKKRPLLVLGHTDTVSVDAAKWTFPPFSATRDGGYVYGRGTLDDKDNATAALMTMLLLKRRNVALDRDVIFLAESGEEGNSRVGIGYMVKDHYPEIDAEYCLAEGGGIARINGEVRYARVQTLEKVPRGIELVAHGISGHGSIPLKSNAVVHLASAVGKIGEWRPDIRLNETTGTYFRRLATVSPPDVAKYYRDVLSTDPKVAKAADDWLYEHEPSHSSMLRTSVSPNIIQGGYRSNVIPSEAKATLDVRMLPDEDPAKFLELVKQVVNDPAVEVRYPSQDVRPSGAEARLDSEAYKTIEASMTRVYNTITLPTMSTGATDMAQLRARGVQCFGIGPAADVEDGPKGFGAHSDQERLLESELHRFVRFNWDVVTELARAK